LLILFTYVFNKIYIRIHFVYTLASLYGCFD